MEGDVRCSEEVADVVVDLCEDESANPFHRRARHRRCFRVQRGWGKLEVGVDTEVQGIGAAEGIRSCEELDLGSSD